MAHINPAFVITSSELAISTGQDRISGKLTNFSKQDKQDRSADPEGSKCSEFKNMIRTKWKWSWVFNGIIVLALCLLIVILELDVIPFRKLGYQCNDPNLSHKYRGDTIRFGYLIAVSVVVPFITILIVQFFVVSANQIYHASWKKRTFLQVLSYYGQFFLGLLVLLFLVQLAKSLITEPRPHFFDTCKPDKINCTGYVEEYKCTNKELTNRDVRDSFRSFPSGHSALGFYVAVFMSWYLQSKIPLSDNLAVPFFQCLFFAWGLLCALTRITDHRHHWWDVLVGSILGAVIAVFAVKVFCKSFRHSIGKVRKQDKNLNDMGSSSNSWYRKMFGKSNSTQPDDRELREVK